MFPRLLWSRFLVDLWLVREIFPLQKALLLNWCRTSFALSSALLICELLITLEENSWKQRSSDGVWANIKEECSGILESAVQGSDFKREIIYAVFWPSECLHFFPYDAIVNSVLDRRETDRSLKWFPSSSSWEASWASWLTGDSFFQDKERELSHFFQSAGLWGCSLATLTHVIFQEI